MNCDALSRTPSARTVARLMTIGRDDLSKSQTVTVAAIEGEVPQLVEAREVVASFQAMIQKKSLADLEPWLERARSSLVAAFANGLAKDRAPVSAAISSCLMLWLSDPSRQRTLRAIAHWKAIAGVGA